MVDAEDLKSFDHCDRVGSSPTIPTKKITRTNVRDFFINLVLTFLSYLDNIPPVLIGCVAQLVRALRSHRRGRRFESAHIHQNFSLFYLRARTAGSETIVDTNKR